VIVLALAHASVYVLTRLSLLESAFPFRNIVIDASGFYVEKRAFSWQPAVYFGALMILAWPLVLFRKLGPSKTPQLAVGFAAACAVLFIAGALLSYSRSTMLGFCLQILTVAVLIKWGRSNERLLARRALALSAAAIALAFLASPSIARRASSLAMGVDGSVLHRSGYFQFALQMIALRPLSGWGTTLYYPLYKAFGAIPEITYYPLDAHSSVLYGLVVHGIAGVALMILALGFPTPRAALALLPRGYLLALVGVAPLLVSENLTEPFFCFILILALMAATVVARNWSHGRLLEKRPPRALAFLPTALFALYIVGVLMPPPSLAKWFERVLYRAAQRATDHICFELQIKGSNFKIAYEPNRPHPSYLASLGVLASYTREAPDELVPVREFRLCEADDTTRILEIPATGLLRAALMRPTSLPTLWLRQNANARLLALHCQRSLGHEGFGQAELTTNSLSCRTCALSLGAENRPDWRLETYLEPTTATTHQVAQLWHELFSRTDPVGQALRRGMEKNLDELGFLRHLPRGSHQYHCSFYTGQTREEVLFCEQEFVANWSLVALYTCTTVRPVVPRPDSAANRQFAELAFRVWSFFDVFDISALPERQYRPLPLLWILDLYKASSSSQ
jgi:hypothetical protein